MPKIVVLGSCRHEPYKITYVPEKGPEELYNTEEGYQLACKKCYPAIRKCDFVILYAPEGTIGEHTRRDLEYALEHGKPVLIVDDKVLKFGTLIQEEGL